MKKISLLRVITAVAVLTPTMSANATLFDYNEQFDADGIHYSLSFTADDTITTEVTALFGTAGPHALILAPLNLFGYSNNMFNPDIFSSRGGWDLGGIGFHNTVTGLDYNLYSYFVGNVAASALADADNILYGAVISNYTFSATPYVTSVPEPTSIALLGLGLFGFSVTRRKKNQA